MCQAWNTKELGYASTQIPLASRNQLVCRGKNLNIVVLLELVTAKNDYLRMARILNLIQECMVASGTTSTR